MRFTAVRAVLRGLILAACYSYAMSVSGFVLLWLLGGEAVPLLAWLTNLLHILLLPFPIALVSVLLYRQRRAALLMLPLMAVWLIIFVPLLLPKTAPQPAGTVLRVATFNVLQGSTAGLLDIARALDADVLALQEFTPASAARFEALLDTYPHTALHPQPGVAGLGIYSRYPMTADEYRRVGNGQQRVLLDVAGLPVVLFNIHTSPPLSVPLQLQRSGQIASLLEWSTSDSGSVIILGDFNMTPLTADYRTVTARYGDAYSMAGQGFGFTYPSWGQAGGLRGIIPPLARIDYVFTSAALLPLHAEVWGQSDAADHRPVIAELALR